VDCGGSEKTGKKNTRRSEREGAPNPKKEGEALSLLLHPPLQEYLLTYVVEFERAENLRGLWESACGACRTHLQLRRRVGRWQGRLH
jgi:hypothetical protein